MPSLHAAFKSQATFKHQNIDGLKIEQTAQSETTAVYLTQKPAQK